MLFLEIGRMKFEDILKKKKEERKIEFDNQLSADDLKHLVLQYKEIVENEKAGFAFPSQSIYVESLPDDQKEIINLKQ